MRPCRVVLFSTAAGVGSVVGVSDGVCGIVRHSDVLVRFTAPKTWGGSTCSSAAWCGSSCPGRPARSSSPSTPISGAQQSALRRTSGARSVVYLCGEVGVGGVILVPGRPIRGRISGCAARSGPWSWIRAARPAAPVPAGCSETEIGEERLLIASGLAESDPAAGSTKSWPQAEQEDLRARRREGRRRPGVARSRHRPDLVDLLNPEVVILGSLLRELAASETGGCRAAFGQGASSPAERVRLALPLLGGDSILFGRGRVGLWPLLQRSAGRLARGAHSMPAWCRARPRRRHPRHRSRHPAPDRLPGRGPARLLGTRSQRPGPVGCDPAIGIARPRSAATSSRAGDSAERYLRPTFQARPCTRTCWPRAWAVPTTNASSARPFVSAFGPDWPWPGEVRRPGASWSPLGGLRRVRRGGKKAWPVEASFGAHGFTGALCGRAQVLLDASTRSSTAPTTCRTAAGPVGGAA